MSDPLTPDRPDFAAADRALAVPHREDDQACGCDVCMDYGAEDNGADWSRFPAANRIVIRALDSGDERLAPLAEAFRDHETADLAADAEWLAERLHDTYAAVVCVSDLGLHSWSACERQSDWLADATFFAARLSNVTAPEPKPDA